MRSLLLRLQFDERTIHPMHAFISADDRYGPTRLRQWNVTSRETSLMVFQVAGPREPYTAALDATPNVRSYEAVELGLADDRFAVLVEDEITADVTGLFQAYADTDVVTVPPVVFNTDRSADLQLVGANVALREMVDRLPEGMQGEIRRLTTGDAVQMSPAERLTARQRHVVEAALRAGYYDEPRDATLDDVADQVDLATGTVAEHVRKAEARLVEHALGADD